MWEQIQTIVWAQIRITRNRFRMTGAGPVLIIALGLLWYAAFGVLAVVVYHVLSEATLPFIRQWLPRGLLGAFLFWQLVPLFTLTGGWSLHLKKLQAFPISAAALFAIEVVLRITTAFEMLLLLIGACLGLMRNPHVPVYAPLSLLLFVPFNLFCALAVRELVTHSFRKNRFREIFSLALISLSTLPSFFLHTRLHGQVNHVMSVLAGFHGTPWQELARLSYGRGSIMAFVIVAIWTAAAYLLARSQFLHSLSQEDLMRAGTNLKSPAQRKGGFLVGILEMPNRLFADPMAALIEKEIRTLLRMPRFRVVFGMACFFSIIIFVPLALESTGTVFVRENFLLVVNLYGLLLLSDTLLWNIFGLDRGAAQIYFVAPLELKTVVRAKNVTAILFVLAQNLVVLVVALLFGFPLTVRSIATSVSASVVVGLFFLSVGNLSSVTIPRPIDPTQTLKKQAGGQIQIWLAGCSLGAFLLIGFAFLARWALAAEWALFAVFAVEFGIGWIVFHVAEEATLARGIRRREFIVDALSKSASQIAM